MYYNEKLISLFSLQRSATIVLAYLVKYEKLELTEALRLVRSKRDVRPNDGFLLQLIEFEEMCKKQ